ncbi:MAG: type I restriction enzyme HsdR N-terminal domain-containing protein [Nitrospira sp.]
MDRSLKKQLQHYIQVFTEGKQRNANEADTVMYITRFLTDVLGYDLFKDITKEFQIRERYCDVAVKINGEVHFLVEVKSMALALSDRHIEQAENYASRAGIEWVILTNGLVWRLYHLTFDTGGIEHDLAFECALGADIDLEDSWECLRILSHDYVSEGGLAGFWEHKKALGSNSLLRALFTEEVLSSLRRQLRRKVSVRVELEDIASGLRRLLNPEVLTEDIRIKKTKKKPRRDVTTPVPTIEPPTDGVVEPPPVVTAGPDGPPLA